MTETKTHTGKVFHRVLKAAKLPDTFSPHSLRHTFASLALAEGESPTWVQTQLGHTSISMTVDTYGKWLPQRPIQGGAALIEGMSRPVLNLRTE
jgi:integrase